MRGSWRHRGQAVFCRQGRCLYARAPYNGHTVLNLQSWGLIDRRGRRYYMHEKTLNSLIGMRSYQQVRRILSNATEELSVLDTLPD